ncbi:hypothetical protein DFR58_11070 [Anaerobacterium chartisolvens]|uniref:Uncharacterized protein n=1 Tax=Anaerobacterium chartisolvens TaxID=1297424 RepID=A0A369B7R6_9FIRM|nr:hypothetical protein [Anaerobacterium chartisolvens]RCX16577.1 hypothetical protein DFR58_11070 [Anaerobacterium chartisolvens]
MKQSKYVQKSILFFYVLLVITAGLMGCERVEQEKQSFNIDSFLNLQESIIENDFAIEKKHDIKELNVDGKYDLNTDGETETIEIRLLGRQDSSLRINNCEISIDCENPFDFYLVDLISDDKFIELAIYDDGPSGDPKTTFYRYDGIKIYELGSFHTDINISHSISTYYGNVLTDGKGNFIPPDSIVKFVSPNIMKGYYSIENNKFIYNSIDYTKYLLDEYIVASDFEAFFIKQSISNKLNKQDIKFTWDIEKAVEFKKGEKIKIIIMDDFWYGIERQDGTTGILYFWMGD